MTTAKKTQIGKSKSDPFRIEIRNKFIAVTEVMNNRNQWWVVSIRDAKDKSAPVDEFKEMCLGILPLYFDDVHRPSEQADFIFPRIEQVRQAVEWSRGKDAILVHCHAGISRSSAIAYVIACDKIGPKEAIKVLDSRLHWPNPLVIALGAEVLGNPEVVNTFIHWKAHMRTQGLV